MDLELRSEDQALQDTAVRFARDVLAPQSDTEGEPAPVGREIFRRCAELGLLGMPVAKDLGGAGLGAVSTVAVLEGLGLGGADSGLLFSINAHLWTAVVPIARHGTDEQRAALLPRLCDGRIIGANGASEPEAGSDVFAMQTRAVRKGSTYVLNGRKAFVTNAPIADLFVVYATVDPALGPMGITAFLVDAKSRGITVGPPLSKMGLRSSPMSEIVLEDVEVAESRRLGREGRGVPIFEDSMSWERGLILSPALGTMRRLLERCLEHARIRKQFQKPIGRFQSIANKLVDMRLRIATSRPLVYRVAELKDTGADAHVESAMAKIHVSECYVETCRDAMQVLGGYGYMAEYGVERELRAALASSLYSGTTEILRNIVARSMGVGG